MRALLASLHRRLRDGDLAPIRAPLALLGGLLLVLLVVAVASVVTGDPSGGEAAAQAKRQDGGKAAGALGLLTPSTQADAAGSSALAAGATHRPARSAGTGGATGSGPSPGHGTAPGEDPSATSPPPTPVTSPTGAAGTPTGTPSPPVTPLRPAPPQASQIAPAVVTHTAHGHGRWVSLTFDDGPTPAYTPQVLALLRQYHVKATFCMIGIQARQFPDLVRRVVADGHRLCNHTMTHDEGLPHRRMSVIGREMSQADAAIHAAVPDASISYFRAPGGAWSANVRRAAAKMGMTPLGWSVDTRDWERPGVKTILANVRNELRPGGVILMHDGGGDRSQTVTALRKLLASLTAQHYSVGFPA